MVISIGFEKNLSMFALIFVKISFTNNVKSKEELGSPCFTPRWDSIAFAICLLYFIADFTDEYGDFFFSAVKIEIFNRKLLIFFLFLHKT